MKNKLWLVFILVTILTWGFWGALSAWQAASFSDIVTPAVVYIIWAITMLPCALVALIINKGHLKHDWKSVGLGCAVGLLGAGGQFILFKALTYGPGYLIYPFISMSPVIVITLAVIFLKERATKWQIAGIVVALIAILLLSLESNTDASVNNWALMIVFAVLVLVAWGVQGFFMKFANNSMDAESIFIWMALSGLVFIPVAFLMDGTAVTFFAGDNAIPLFWQTFGIQILNSIGALTLVYAYRYGKAVVVSPMEGLSPMVQVLLCFLIMSAVPSPVQIVGLVCAAFAMYALSK